MRKRRALWLVAALVLLSAAAVGIPASPFYLPELLNPQAQYDGHFAGYWINVLHHADPSERAQAAHALGAIGAAAEPAAQFMGELMLQDPDRGVRVEASLALSKMGAAAGPAVASLTQALKHEDPFIRMNATSALARLRSGARQAIPALTQAILDRGNETNAATFFCTIQEASIFALGRASAGSDEAVPALTELLSGGTGATRIAAARALGEVGAEARSALPRMRLLLREKNPDLHLALEEALVKIEGESAARQDLVQETADSQDPQLTEDEKSYLWEIEHHGNLLVKYGFGPLGQALKNADGPALVKLLAGNFQGSALRDPQRIRAVTDYANIERFQDAGHPADVLDGQAFVARLLELRKIFAPVPPQVKIALMTLSPKQRGQLDGPWEGTAQLRLYGEHARNAPAEVVIMMHYEVARPAAETLSRPGWLRSLAVLQITRAQAPHYLFAEVSRQRGLKTAPLHDNWTAADLVTNPGGVYITDFDRDGILDMLVTDVTGNTLYRGRPDGSLEDVTAQCGLPRGSHGHTVAAWVDLDGDGWEDLLLEGRVYRNDQGRRFVDYTDRCNLHLPDAMTGVVVADYDRDGKLDLYVTRSGRPARESWLKGRTDDSSGNFLYHNLGNWKFEEVSRLSGTLGGGRSSFTAAWLDANNDGWPDLHVINEFGDGVLLINNQDGTFSEHALADRPADYGSMGVAVGDINNDGNIDIYCADMYSKAGKRVIGNLSPDAYSPVIMEKMRRFVAGSQLHLNKGGLKFEQAGSRMQVAGVGWAYGPCLADLDNDGWLDIFATCGYVSRSRDDPDG